MVSIVNIENKRISLLKELDSTSSESQRLIHLHDFYSILISSDDELVLYSYGVEFIQSYITHLKKYNPLYKSPDETRNILQIAERIAESDRFAEYKGELDQAVTEISLLLNNLIDILEGTGNASKSMIYFPLIENSVTAPGILDSVSVKIYRDHTKNTFVIIPSERDIETRLKEQVEISWKKAVEYVTKFKIKVKGFHKVYISFDEPSGFYTGNSLGAALFVAFLEELLVFYKSPTVVNTNSAIALTGGINNDGFLLPVSQQVIEKKTETVFFSGVGYFIVPKEDEFFAVMQLKKLAAKYPQRNLKIVSIEEIDDLINRRNLISIRKQPAITRGANFVLRNPLSIILGLLLITVVLFYNSVIWDKNPAFYDMSGDILKIKNKLGQVLWTKQMFFNVDAPLESYYEMQCCRIVDINDDGINEVIISLMKDVINEVICFSNKSERIWKYSFKDEVKTKKINHTTSYVSYLIDTLSQDGNKLLYLIGRNLPLYPNAVYKLSLMTGERFDSINTVWHSGGITDVLLGDFNQDGDMELAGVGINNGYERAVFFSVDLKNLKGQFPAPDYYTFPDFNLTAFNEYIIFPQTDFSYALKNRYNSAKKLYYYKDTNEFEITVYENVSGGAVIYSLSSDFKVKLVDCSDEFAFLRDDLIRKGKLKPPYTNTFNFFGPLREKVIYLKPETVKNFNTSFEEKRYQEL